MIKALMFLVFLICSLPNTAYSKGLLTVGIIDTGLDLNDPRFKRHLCKSGHADFSDQGIADTNGHGTHVTGLIISNAKNVNYCLVIFKYFNESRSLSENMFALVRALEEVKFQKIDIVNISSSGPGAYMPEYLAIKTNTHSIFFVAAGNESNDMDLPEGKAYPAAYPLNNINVVGNLGKNNFKFPSSNYGSMVKYWELGEDIVSTGIVGTKKLTGSSQATAIKTGKYIYENYR